MHTSAKQAAKALQRKVWANEISDLGPRSAIWRAQMQEFLVGWETEEEEAINRTRFTSGTNE